MCGALAQGLGALRFTEFCLLPTLGCGGRKLLFVLPLLCYSCFHFFVLPLLCSALAARPRGKGEVLCGSRVASDVTPKPIVLK